MRCYLMRGGHIAAVELVDQASDDGVAISQAVAIFVARMPEDYEGFEIWDHKRVVYRYPDEVLPKLGHIQSL